MMMALLPGQVPSGAPPRTFRGSLSIEGTVREADELASEEKGKGLKMQPTMKKREIQVTGNFLPRGLN